VVVLPKDWSSTRTLSSSVLQVYVDGASTSALQALYMHDGHILAAGYDQRVNLFQVHEKEKDLLEIVWKSAVMVQVADITGFAVRSEKISSKGYDFVVLGYGMQRVSLDLEE
jgi:hypothetical protein